MDRLVIFDCDGVLVDSEPLYARVDTEILNDMGWPITQAEVIGRFQGTTHEFMMEAVEQRLGRETREQWEPLMKDRRRRVFRRELQPIDGVREALDAIDLDTCVASSSTHEFIRLVLDITGLLARFEGRIYSAQDVEHGKPAPDVFLHAARSMGFEPAACIVIEDSVAGVKAGRAAGMTVLGYTGGEDKPLAGPSTTVFGDMRELPALLHGLG